MLSHFQSFFLILFTTFVLLKVSRCQSTESMNTTLKPEIWELDFEIYRISAKSFSRRTRIEALDRHLKGFIVIPPRYVTILGRIEGEKEQVDSMWRWLRDNAGLISDVELVSYKRIPDYKSSYFYLHEMTQRIGLQPRSYLIIYK